MAQPTRAVGIALLLAAGPALGVFTPSEEVLAQDGSGTVQAFLEETRDRGFPGGCVATKHDEHDARVDARAGRRWLRERATA